MLKANKTLVKYHNTSLFTPHSTQNLAVLIGYLLPHSWQNLDIRWVTDGHLRSFGEFSEPLEGGLPNGVEWVSGQFNGASFVDLARTFGAFLLRLQQQ